MKLFFFLLVICMASSARRSYAETTKWNGASLIAFSGTSTLHNWSGTVKARPFTATVTVDVKGQPTHLASTVEVAAATMDTAEPDRDVKMRDSMQVKQFPLISGAMDADFNKIAVGQATPNALPFSLTLLGKKQEVRATISKWALKGDVATFDLDFDLSLKASGIQVPSMFLVVRVGDAIHVHAAVKLTRASG